jgi:hypothetical protein
VSKDPEEFGVRHFRISACKGIVAIEIVILRYPTERQESSDVEERTHTCIGVQHFGILGDEKLMTGEVAKSQNATVPQSEHFSGGHVAIYIGVQGIESPMYIDNENLDILIRDFPIGLQAP